MSIRLGKDADDAEELHEINVTPFIDVILVLMIIFMIAAPLATVDVAVDLPNSNAKAEPRPDKPIFITLKADLGISIGDSEVLPDELGTDLDNATDSDKTHRIYIRADKTVPYGELMQLMNRLRSAGYTKIALVGMDAGAAQ